LLKTRSQVAQQQDTIRQHKHVEHETTERTRREQCCALTSEEPVADEIASEEGAPTKALIRWNDEVEDGDAIKSTAKSEKMRIDGDVPPSAKYPKTGPVRPRIRWQHCVATTNHLTTLRHWMLIRCDSPVGPTLANQVGNVAKRRSTKIAFKLAVENSTPDVRLDRALVNPKAIAGTVVLMVLQQLRHTTANIFLQVFSLRACIFAEKHAKHSLSCHQNVPRLRPCCLREMYRTSDFADPSCRQSATSIIQTSWVTISKSSHSPHRDYLANRRAFGRGVLTSLAPHEPRPLLHHLANTGSNLTPARSVLPCSSSKADRWV
jgi:hypothetical protein